MCGFGGGAQATYEQLTLHTGQGLQLAISARPSDSKVLPQWVAKCNRIAAISTIKKCPFTSNQHFSQISNQLKYILMSHVNKDFIWKPGKRWERIDILIIIIGEGPYLLLPWRIVSIFWWLSIIQAFKIENRKGNGDRRDLVNLYKCEAKRLKPQLTERKGLIQEIWVVLIHSLRLSLTLVLSRLPKLSLLVLTLCRIFLDS